MKRTCGLFFALALAGCAAPETRQPVAKAACEPPPAQLVTTDLKVGDGREVRSKTTSAIVVYTGWLYDPCAPEHKGTQFDSNADQRVPFGFVVGAGRVIKGWDEGVVGMKEGGKRQLVIPPDKGYGARDMGKIPPNSTLVFDVSLVQLTDPTQPPPKK